MVNEAALQLRRRAGSYLRKLRNAKGLTLREVSLAIGFKYYTFLSQIEIGAARLPSDFYEPVASMYGVSPQTLAKKLTMYYEPDLYKALFGAPSRDDLRA